MSDSIKVAIRVRPLIKREVDQKLRSQWRVQGNTISSTNSEAKNCIFKFDNVFNSKTTSKDIFDALVKPIVESAVNGFNGTVFAYGQTSSGKTHTMMGSDNEPGLISLAVKHLFETIYNSCGREFLLKVSYLEIYNEKVNDLLVIGNKDLKLRDDVSGLVRVLGCNEELVSSAEDVLNCLEKGNENRKANQTDMNEKSSRSHAIFRIVIESRKQSDDPDQVVQISQLNLVDLAGSEKTGQAQGTRFKEVKYINLSLLSLSTVIKQLSEATDLRKFVAFRNSKLTRLLQASLGGNAMTVMICHMTPVYLEETQCTLSFALRAKKVKNQPKLNQIESDVALLKKYQKQIEKLNNELESLKEEKQPEVERIFIEEKTKIQTLQNIIMSHNDVKNEIPAKKRRTWSGYSMSSSNYSVELDWKDSGIQLVESNLDEFKSGLSNDTNLTPGNSESQPVQSMETLQYKMDSYQRSVKKSISLLLMNFPEISSLSKDDQEDSAILEKLVESLINKKDEYKNLQQEVNKKKDETILTLQAKIRYLEAKSNKPQNQLKNTSLENLQLIKSINNFECKKTEFEVSEIEELKKTVIIKNVEFAEKVEQMTKLQEKIKCLMFQNSQWEKNAKLRNERLVKLIEENTRLNNDLSSTLRENQKLKENMKELKPERLEFYKNLIHFKELEIDRLTRNLKASKEAQKHFENELSRKSDLIKKDASLLNYKNNPLKKHEKEINDLKLGELTESTRWFQRTSDLENTDTTLCINTKEVESSQVKDIELQKLRDEIQDLKNQLKISQFTINELRKKSINVRPFTPHRFQGNYFV